MFSIEVLKISALSLVLMEAIESILPLVESRLLESALGKAPSGKKYQCGNDAILPSSVIKGLIVIRQVIFQRTVKIFQITLRTLLIQ